MCAQQEMCHERNRKLSEEGESKKEEMIKLWQNVDGYKSFLLVTLDRHVVVECIKWLCCEKESFSLLQQVKILMKKFVGGFYEKYYLQGIGH